MKTVLGAAAAIAVVIAGSVQAEAPLQQGIVRLPAICGSQSAVEAAVASVRETAQATALASVGSQTIAVTVYVSRTGAWTLVGVRPDGSACVLLVGESWDQDGL